MLVSVWERDIINCRSGYLVVARRIFPHCKMTLSMTSLIPSFHVSSSSFKRGRSKCIFCLSLASGSYHHLALVQIVMVNLRTQFFATFWSSPCNIKIQHNKPMKRFQTTMKCFVVPIAFVLSCSLCQSGWESSQASHRLNWYSYRGPKHCRAQRENWKCAKQNPGFSSQLRCKSQFQVWFYHYGILLQRSRGNIPHRCHGRRHGGLRRTRRGGHTIHGCPTDRIFAFKLGFGSHWRDEVATWQSIQIYAHWHWCYDF